SDVCSSDLAFPGLQRLTSPEAPTFGLIVLAMAQFAFIALTLTIALPKPTKASGTLASRVLQALRLLATRTFGPIGRATAKFAYIASQSLAAVLRRCFRSENAAVRMNASSA